MRQHSKKIRGSKPSSRLTLKTRWCRNCGCCDDPWSWDNWRILFRINIFLKRLDFTPKSPFLTGNVCYYYNTWVTGVYMTYMFDRNSGGKISNWIIIWINLKTFSYFKSPTVLWHFLDPSYKAICLQELAGCFKPSLLPDAQNRTFAKNKSCIQILYTTLYTGGLKQCS